MKIILTVLCVVALATLANTISASWGRRNNTDTLLLSEKVLRYPNKNTWDVSVVFPKSGQANSRTITLVLVNDGITNSSGAYPSLESGGPGWRFATVKLRSQYNRGINSTVQIYGK